MPYRDRQPCIIPGCLRHKTTRTGLCCWHHQRNKLYGSPLGEATRKTDEQRFWGFVDKINGPIHPIYGQCWVWTGANLRGGYGVFWYKARNVTAHRASWEINVGITGNLHVLHKCDNRSCVRPDHLFLGTNADNMADRNKKGRAARKLTESDAREVRRRYVRGSSTNGTTGLAKEFGVSQQTIQGIVDGIYWKHAIESPE